MWCLKISILQQNRGGQARYVSGSGQHVRIRVEQGPIVAQGPQAALALSQDLTASDATGDNAKQY